jgi:hypothetical protein
MDKKETQTKVRELLNSGIKKSEVFTQLSGQGIKDSQLAYLIASYADPNLCRKNKGKVYLLITIMVFQALLAFLVGLSTGSDIGSNSK